MITPLTVGGAAENIKLLSDRFSNFHTRTHTSILNKCLLVLLGKRFLNDLPVAASVASESPKSLLVPPFGVVPPPYLTNPSTMPCLAWRTSHGPNLVIHHIPSSIKPCTPPHSSFRPALSSFPPSHFPFLLLSNCQAAPGASPASEASTFNFIRPQEKTCLSLKCSSLS